MENTKKFVCICCPMGCPLEVTDRDGQITVVGNTCKRGENYGITEMTAPTRTVTSSCKCISGIISRVSVKTASPVPKSKIFDVLREIGKVAVTAPVSIGDVIIENAAGTGVNVVATRDIAAK